MREDEVADLLSLAQARASGTVARALLLEDERRRRAWRRLASPESLLVGGAKLAPKMARRIGAGEKVSAEEVEGPLARP